MKDTHAGVAFSLSVALSADLLFESLPNIWTCLTWVSCFSRYHYYSHQTAISRHALPSLCLLLRWPAWISLTWASICWAVTWSSLYTLWPDHPEILLFVSQVTSSHLCICNVPSMLRPYFLTLSFVSKTPNISAVIVRSKVFRWIDPTLESTYVSICWARFRESTHNIVLIQYSNCHNQHGALPVRCSRPTNSVTSLDDPVMRLVNDLGHLSRFLPFRANLWVLDLSLSVDMFGRVCGWMWLCRHTRTTPWLYSVYLVCWLDDHVFTKMKPGELLPIVDRQHWWITGSSSAKF